MHVLSRLRIQGGPQPGERPQTNGRTHTHAHTRTLRDVISPLLKSLTCMYVIVRKKAVARSIAVLIPPSHSCLLCLQWMSGVV